MTREEFMAVALPMADSLVESLVSRSQQSDPHSTSRMPIAIVGPTGDELRALAPALTCVLEPHWDDPDLFIPVDGFSMRDAIFTYSDWVMKSEDQIRGCLATLILLPPTIAMEDIADIASPNGIDIASKRAPPSLTFALLAPAAPTGPMFAFDALNAAHRVDPLLFRELRIRQTWDIFDSWKFGKPDEPRPPAALGRDPRAHRLCSIARISSYWQIDGGVDDGTIVVLGTPPLSVPLDVPLAEVGMHFRRFHRGTNWPRQCRTTLHSVLEMLRGNGSRAEDDHFFFGPIWEAQGRGLDLDDDLYDLRVQYLRSRYALPIIEAGEIARFVAFPFNRSEISIEPNVKLTPAPEFMLRAQLNDNADMPEGSYGARCVDPEQFVLAWNAGLVQWGLLSTFYGTLQNPKWNLSDLRSTLVPWDFIDNVERRQQRLESYIERFDAVTRRLDDLDPYDFVEALKKSLVNPDDLNGLDATRTPHADKKIQRVIDVFRSLTPDTDDIEPIDAQPPLPIAILRHRLSDDSNPRLWTELCFQLVQTFLRFDASIVLGLLRVSSPEAPKRALIQATRWEDSGKMLTFGDWNAIYREGRRLLLKIDDEVMLRTGHSEAANALRIKRPVDLDRHVAEVIRLRNEIAHGRTPSDAAMRSLAAKLCELLQHIETGFSYLSTLNLTATLELHEGLEGCCVIECSLNGWRGEIIPFRRRISSSDLGHYRLGVHARIGNSRPILVTPWMQVRPDPHTGERCMWLFAGVKKGKAQFDCLHANVGSLSESLSSDHWSELGMTR